MKFLIIQTAFIGDVILATALIEKLRRHYPQAQIDFLLRKGNEPLLEHHPHLTNLWVWDKRGGKYRNLFALLAPLRAQRYDTVINLQRFATTGLLSILLRAVQVIGFAKNPFSPLFSLRVPHRIGNGEHEVSRNLQLIASLTDTTFERPRLYPTPGDFAAVAPYRQRGYITISPASVWFTKQFPAHKWAELVAWAQPQYTVYLLGAKGDGALCRSIVEGTPGSAAIDLSGKLTLLQSAALMSGAAMNYTNDSAPLHLASATNAPTTCVFCSTVPAFGFGPLSDNARIVETPTPLPCRPCGLHGSKACPKKHFQCAENIDVKGLRM